MIIVKLISGLGNQLFQYAMGRQLALKSNSKLLLDTSNYPDSRLRTYKLDKYNIKAKVATYEELTSLTANRSRHAFLNKVYKRAEGFLPKHRRRIYKETDWWGYEPEVYKIKSNILIEGYWQNYKYYEAINPAIFEELTLTHTYSGRSVEILSSINSNPASVSLHIRRGDYVTDSSANSFMGLLPLEYYSKAINYMSKQVEKPNFYIFSDDLDWAKKNLKIGYPAVYVDNDEDYIELDLMCRCKHNIIANSSYSWWGAFLNKNPGKIIVAPHKWVLPEDINKQIQIKAQSWITF